LRLLADSPAPTPPRRQITVAAERGRMSIPVAEEEVDRLLAPYPHVAYCPVCREYADAYLGAHSASTVLAAVLNHHDSAHANDRLNSRYTSF
jgi:hypothetical protein